MYWNDTAFAEEINGTWLTLTWDVLKYVCIFTKCRTNAGLTLTWDVLKSHYLERNVYGATGLTLTWDVLK